MGGSQGRQRRVAGLEKEKDIQWRQNTLSYNIPEDILHVKQPYCNLRSCYISKAVSYCVQIEPYFTALLHVYPAPPRYRAL